MKLLITVIPALLLLCVSLTSAARKLPEYIKVCKRYDPNIADCYKEMFRVIIKKMADGIPQMNLRKIEPLHLEQLILNQGNSSSLGFKATLSDVDMYGLSNLNVLNASIDMKTLVFKLDLITPSLYLTSKFNAKGRVLLFQIDSDGTWTGNLTNIRVKGTWNGRETVKKGKTHLIFDLPKLDVTVETLKMNFENLFPNQEINDRTNQAINENIDVLYDEVKPLIEETVKAVVIDSVNNVYAIFPYDVLFPAQ